MLRACLVGSPPFRARSRSALAMTDVICVSSAAGGANAGRWFKGSCVGRWDGFARSWSLSHLRRGVMARRLRRNFKNQSCKRRCNPIGLRRIGMGFGG